MTEVIQEIEKMFGKMTVSSSRGGQGHIMFNANGTVIIGMWEYVKEAIANFDGEITKKCNLAS